MLFKVSTWVTSPKQFHLPRYQAPHRHSTNLLLLPLVHEAMLVVASPVMNFFPKVEQLTLATLKVYQANKHHQGFFSNFLEPAIFWQVRVSSLL